MRSMRTSNSTRRQLLVADLAARHDIFPVGSIRMTTSTTGAAISSVAHG